MKCDNSEDRDKALKYLKHHIGEIQSYEDIKKRFANSIRQFIVKKHLKNITYVEEFGREIYEITIRHLNTEDK